MEKTYIIVLVTTANRKEAETIAQKLLEKKLIACVNIIDPIASHFHWAGKTEKTQECLILMKSRKDLFNEIAETVKAMHSYEVPEILALPVVAGSKDYLDWLDRCLTQG